MRYLFLMLLPVIAQVQDSCVVFNPEVNYAVRMMGYMPSDPEWTEVDYVVHIHHTDSFPNSYVSDVVVYDANEHLNEEFEEAMFSFNLLAIQYHDLDDYEDGPLLIQPYNTCVPYTYFGFTSMDEYLGDIVWDREVVMNVHVFPQFCQGILGFAWTAYTELTDLDGVWIRSDVFGRIGPQLTTAFRDQNKTMIHEVGHYLGLHHPFRDVEYCGQDLGPCEESGDYVCDTPPIKLSWSCENPVCPPGLYDYTADNHMDYYVDSCRQHFTPGQIERMHAVLPITRPGIGTGDPYCAGDLSGDLVVGMNDLMLMLANNGNIDWVEGDLNGDGFFTVLDIQALLANWGQTCFGAELDPFYREEVSKSVIREVLPHSVRD